MNILSVYNYVEFLSVCFTVCIEVAKIKRLNTQCDTYVLGLILFQITELERSISQPTKYYQPTSVHTSSFFRLSSPVYEL